MNNTTQTVDQRTTFLELLEEYGYERPQRGQILEGTVLRVEPDALLVDVGSKRDAIVPHQELTRLDDEFLEGISAGDTVPVYVVHVPNGNEELLVSLEKGLQQEDWIRAEKLKETGDIRELEVTGYNKGGVTVRYKRLEGFVPNSHVPALRRIYDAREKQAQKARLMGQNLAVKVIDVEQQQERLVFSAREAEKEQRRMQLAALTPGEQVSGQVTALVKFGAFVDLGHLDGLIHISKLDHEHVRHPSEVLQVGDEVEVLIEEVDIQRERVSLNRQALLPDPWATLTAGYEVGQLVEGVIDNVVEFGIFVRLSTGLVGLAHISELDLPAGIQPTDRFQKEDVVLTRIISMEPERQRLSLSLRRVSMREEVNWMSDRSQQEAADQEAEATPAPDSEITDETMLEVVA